MNNKKYYSEAVDSEGNEQNRFKRFGNRFLIGIKSSVRTLILRFKVWLWPSYLWSDAVNICKLIVRTGTRQNESYNMDLMKLMRDAGDGKFKTGKEFNNAKQQIMAKYNLRKQRLLDNKQISLSTRASSILENRRLSK